MCFDGSCAGSARDQYLSSVQMNRQQLAQQEAFARRAVLVAAGAAAAPFAAVIAANLCLSNPVLCTEAGVAFVSGLMQGTLRGDTGTAPSSWTEYLTEGVGKYVGESICQ